MTHGFWDGGFWAYQAGLKQQHDENLSRLRAKLRASSTNEQRRHIREEIRAAKQAYRQQLRSSGRLLF